MSKIETLTGNDREKMREALLWEKIDSGRHTGDLRCRLCPKYCIIEEGKYGECLVRLNDSGALRTITWGMARGMAVDPIEKKPFYHFKPGSRALSFGTPGCNFRCLNCQNWDLSQYYLEAKDNRPEREITPREIVDASVHYKADGIAYTYSEPLIFFEYARDTILEAKKHPQAQNMYHVFISNGFLSKEALDLIEKEELIDAINIDLKFMDDGKYKKICGARLKPVLKTIERLGVSSSNIHLEVINLVIPGLNDREEDFKLLSSFLKEVSPEIPLHFSRFFPHYKMKNNVPTGLDTLAKAKEIAEAEGMKYVYIGNADIPGSGDTRCPNCGELLIGRHGYRVTDNDQLRNDGKGAFCGNCNERIKLVQ